MGSFLSSLLTASAGASEAGSSRVVAYHSANHWQLHFNSVKDSNQLMMVDFAASWCGPCGLMAPAVAAMASKFSEVDFANIDVDELPIQSKSDDETEIDELPDVAKDFGVEAMPTFVLIKRGKEVDRIVGAKKDELEKKIHEHSKS